MTRNMSLPDQIARLVIGLVLLGIAMSGTVTAVWSWILGIIAVYGLVTAGLGYCPLYRVFDFSTNRRTET